MGAYQRKCLVATNFWRIAGGLEEIKVPKSDKEYHKYFTDASRAKAIELFENKKWLTKVSATKPPLEPPLIETLTLF